MDDEPVWLTYEDVSEIHYDQLAIFGGLAGVRDSNVVHSAIAAPSNKYHYEGVEDVAMLGIILCCALVRNHGFQDGNKRTSTAAMIEFLAINGYDLIIPDDEAASPLLGQWIEKVAAGSLSELQLYERVRPFIRERG